MSIEDHLRIELSGSLYSCYTRCSVYTGVRQSLEHIVMVRGMIGCICLED
jgi:hypothetical protein